MNTYQHYRKLLESCPDVVKDKNWDEHVFVENMKQYNDFNYQKELEDDIQIKYIDTKTISYNKDDDCCDESSHFNLPIIKNGYIDNIYLIINNIDYNEELIYDILDIYIVLIGMGNSDLIYMPLNINLLFSSLFNKEIEIYENYIKIPIIGLNFNGKFSLNTTYSIMFEYEFINNYETKLEYDYFESEDNHINSFQYMLQADKYAKDCVFKHIYNSILLNQSNNIAKVYFSGIVKFLLVEFIDDYDSPEIIDGSLNKIELHYDNNKNITWNMNDGEIIVYNMYGRTYYMVSLTPEIKTMEDIKTMFDITNDILYGLKITSWCHVVLDCTNMTNTYRITPIYQKLYKGFHYYKFR
jgi:hypothetical protein